VTIVLPEAAKGLEFDAVVVVEPAAIASAGEHGLRLLYIALTRAVRTLTVVHTAPVPGPLR
jgi:DNA helicase IV